MIELKINEIDKELLERHNEKILKKILDKMDKLINLINDDEYLKIYLNPNKDYGDDEVFEKILYWRVSNNHRSIEYILEKEKHFTKYKILYADGFDKFEKRIKESYIRHLKQFED